MIRCLQSPLALNVQDQIRSMLRGDQMANLKRHAASKVDMYHAEAMRFSVKTGDGDFSKTIAQELSKAGRYQIFLEVLEEFSSGGYNFTVSQLESIIKHDK